MKHSPLFFVIVCSLLVGSFTRAQPPAGPRRTALAQIENSFQLDERLLAGSSPESEAAFAALSLAGVKTIISVDGARPNVELAKKHGMRYVHLPVGYDGISAEQVAGLAKAAEGEPGKIFVHCHHGKHRGPAAAVICQSISNWSPEQAETWLREAGTGAEYAGLYRAVRDFQKPSEEAKKKVGELPEVAETDELVDAMVEIDEHFEAVSSAVKGEWSAAAAEQATLLWEALRELGRAESTKTRPADYQKKMSEGEAAVELLRKAEPAARAAALARVKESCVACHKAHRNERN